jgi:hypothetical protein
MRLFEEFEETRMELMNMHIVFGEQEWFFLDDPARYEPITVPPQMHNVLGKEVRMASIVMYLRALPPEHAEVEAIRGMLYVIAWKFSGDRFGELDPEQADFLCTYARLTSGDRSLSTLDEAFGTYFVDLL